MKQNNEEMILKIFNYDFNEIKKIFQSKTTVPLHKKAEIVPNNEWDFFKIIEFLSYMPSNYTTNGVLSTEHLNFYKKLKIFDNERVALEVYISKDCSKQKVYLKSYTDWFNINEQSRTLSVRKIEFSFQKISCHPLIVFGKYYGHAKRQPSPLIRNIFLDLFKRPDQKKRKNENMELMNLLKSLPGYIEVCEQQTTGNGLQISEDHEIQRITWICAWASERLRETQYIELDTSFKATKPYVYCCVHSIINNESIIIGITITTTESSKLYEETYLAFEKSGINSTLLNRIPVLTDMGTGLFTFCSNRNIKQFLCHRHMLETFGNPIFKSWVKRLLECTSEEEYDITCVLISHEINLWTSTISDPSQLSNKIIDIQCMIDKFSISNYYRYEKWALWIRANYSVGRCTNHAESMHHVFNSHIHPFMNLLRRINIIIDYTFKHFNNHNLNHGRSMKEKFWKMKAISRGSDDTTIKQSCNCGWNEFYSKLFGVEFPCIHKIRSIDKCPTPPDITPLMYAHTNNISYVISNEIRSFDLKQINTANNYNIEIEDVDKKHFVKTYIGPNTKRAKEILWEVVNELAKIFEIRKDDSLDIAIDVFSELHLNQEDCVTIENLALFRVSCWKKAEVFNKNP